MHFQAFEKYVLTTCKMRPSSCRLSGSVDARRKGDDRKNAKGVALQFREACENTWEAREGTRSVREDAARIVKGDKDLGQSPGCVFALKPSLQNIFPVLLKYLQERVCRLVKNA